MQYIPSPDDYDVRAAAWYPAYLAQITAAINNYAAKRKFRENDGQIQLLGIEGDVKYGAATRAEWTALQEDIDRGVREETVSFRPQSRRIPLSELEESLEWCEKKGKTRLIILASCPARVRRQSPPRMSAPAKAAADPLVQFLCC